MRIVIFGLVVAPLMLGAIGCSGLIDELPTTPDPVIVTEAFNGTLTVNGGVTHPVFTTATGAVTATLTSLGDTPPPKIGFSIGTLTPGNNCNIVIANDSAVVATVVTGTVSSLAGTLCVRVYDVGVLTGPVDYTFTVSHP